MRNLTNACLAVGLILGLAACSGGEAEAQPDAAESSSAKMDPKDEKVAREALVSVDLKTLSDHKAESKKPKYVASEQAPFADCAGKEADSLGVVGHVTQEFTGDPKLKASGFVVDGDGTEVFYKLRKLWRGADCQSLQTDSDRGSVSFVQSQEIDRPHGVDGDSWFGACYTAFRAKTGESGKCVVIYRIGDNGIAEIVSTQDSSSNTRVDGFMRELVAEALGG